MVDSGMHVLNRHRLFTGIALAAVLMIAGCDQTTFDPFDNDNRYYTVWGFLDELKTEHVVRVVPVTRFQEDIVGPNAEGSTIDAEVFSTDLDTNERIQWTHRLEQLEDGSWGHTFRSRFIVRAGHTYRLEVIRSDGKSSVAETTVPRIIEPKIFLPADVSYNADSTEIWQDVLLPNISSPWELWAIYVAGASTNFRIRVPYGRVGERTEDGSWRTRLNLSDDQGAVRDYLGALPNEQGAMLASVGLQIRILDEAWDPPEGVFDPEVLAQPNVMTNVQHGYGFWGSIGFHAEEWTIPTPPRLLGFPFK